MYWLSLLVVSTKQKLFKVTQPYTLPSSNFDLQSRNYLRLLNSNSSPAICHYLQSRNYLRLLNSCLPIFCGCYLQSRNYLRLLNIAYEVLPLANLQSRNYLRLLNSKLMRDQIGSTKQKLFKVTQPCINCFLCVISTKQKLFKVTQPSCILPLL